MRLMSYSGGGVDDEGGAPARRVDCGGKPSLGPPSPGIGALSLFIFLATNLRPKIRVKTAPQKNFGAELLSGARTEIGELEDSRPRIRSTLGCNRAEARGNDERIGDGRAVCVVCLSLYPLGIFRVNATSEKILHLKVRCAVCSFLL
jgi:hypothetical protein